jgi:hypothetical protein
MKSFGSEGNIVKFYETHGTILLGSETQALIAQPLQKHRR